MIVVVGGGIAKKNRALREMRRCSTLGGHGMFSARRARSRLSPSAADGMAIFRRCSRSISRHAGSADCHSAGRQDVMTRDSSAIRLLVDSP